MLIERLNKVYADDCDADLLEDVEIEMGQASNTVNVYMQILSTSMDTFASVISNNVNDIMKRMTSISIILMVPTLVAKFLRYERGGVGGSRCFPVPSALL